MKYFIVFSLLFMALSITPLNAINATIHNSNVISVTHSPSIMVPHKQIDTRVEKGKKLKRVAGYLFGIGLFSLIIGGGLAKQAPFSPVSLIFVILGFLCFVVSLILFLVGLAMQNSWN
jgi:hypothetical protein